MGFLSSIPIVEYFNDRFDVRENDCIDILYYFSVIDYSYDDFQRFLKLEFIPETKDYFKPETLEDILKLFEIRSKKEPPLPYKWNNVEDMFNELRSVKFKELKQTKNSIYNVQLNNEKICIISYYAIKDEIYNTDLYEFGFIDEYKIIDLLESARAKHQTYKKSYTFQGIMIDIIAKIIKNIVAKQFKIDKTQKSLFPRNEKDYSESRLMYRVTEAAKNLYSDDIREMLSNIEEFKTGSRSPSKDTLFSIADGIGDIYDMFLHENINPLDVFMKKYNLSKVYDYPYGYAMQ